MSEPESEAETGSESETETEIEIEIEAGKRPRRRRRRILKLLLALVLLGAVGRLLLPSLLPSIFDSLLAEVDMGCRIDSVSLSLTGGEIVVEGVEVWFRSDQQHLLSAAELRGRVRLSALLGGQVLLEDVRGRDLEATLVRDANGRLELVNKILAALPPEVLEKESDGEPLPVRIDHVEVDGLRLRWEDHTVEPPARLQLLGHRITGEHVIPRVDGTPAQIKGKVTLGSAGIAFVTSYQDASWGGLQVELAGGELPLLEAAPYLTDAGLALVGAPRLIASGVVRIGEPRRGGGLRLQLELERLVLGQQGLRLVAEPFSLDARRLDPEERVYRFSRIAGRIQTLELGLTEQGDLRASAVAFPAAEGGEQLPDISLAELSLEVEAVSIAPVTTGAAPLRLRDLKLSNTAGGVTKRIALWGSRLQDSLPLYLEASGRVEAVCERLGLSFHLSSVGRRPEFDLELDLAGLDGEGLEALSPTLAGRLSRLDGMSLSADVQATFDRALRDLRFGASLSAQLLIEDLRLGAADHGARPLLAFEELVASIGSLELEPFDLSVERLEVVGMTSEAARLEEGWRVGGIQLSQVGDQPPQGAPRVEVRQFSIDMDSLVLADHSVRPRAQLKLTDVDLSGKLRVGGDDANAHLQVLVEAAGETINGDLDQLRLVVNRVAAGGRGEFSVTDLDLRQLRGMLVGLGVDLRAGRLDTDLTLKRQREGGSLLTGQATLRELELADAGNLGGFLALPTGLSLEAALFLLRDHEGEIRVPIKVEITESGEGDRISRAVAIAIGRALGRAVLTSPLRSLAGLERLGVGLVRLIPGLSWFDEEDEAPTFVRFAPADRHLGPKGQARLEALRERLRDDDDLIVSVRHLLGGGDVRRVRIRTLPPPQVLRDLVARLVWQLQVVEQRRLAQVAQVEVAVSAGDAHAADDAAERVRRFELEVGRLHENIDQVLELLRDDADRRARRRLRRSCQALAAARLEEVARVLCSGIPQTEGRVRVLRPRFSEPDDDRGGRVEVSISER